jgi:hypothetical protein
MLRRSIKILGWFLAGLVWVAATSAQEFRYQFQDKPYPEANVVVVRHEIVPGESNQWFLEGRVFNRGVKPAMNVRVVYSARRSGVEMPGNPIYLNPGVIPPTSFANFRERLPQISDPRDIFLTVHVQWDN